MTVLVAIAAFLLGAIVAAPVMFVLRHRHPVVVSEEPLAVGSVYPSSAIARRILGLLDVGVVLVDRDESPVFVNDLAATMRVVEDGRLTMPALIELVRRVTDSGDPGVVAIDLAASPGGPELLTYVVRALPMDEDDRVAAVVLLFSDVTNERRLERVRRDFVANVSHELKTPVGALSLLAEAVQDAADDPEAVARFAARMQRESSRLGRLVQELIELSRLQGAEPLPGQTLVDVDSVVHEAVDRSRLHAEQTGISVVIRAEDGLLVRGNETQLTTALANLVDNAIAYSPERTRIGVTARAVAAADGQVWVEISVTDQGIGIAEGELDRVFERFYRVDQARSRATGGTGLGLAIVKHVATNHGGSVGVWSVLGSGSTFTVRLPYASASAVPQVSMQAAVAVPEISAVTEGN